MTLSRRMMNCHIFQGCHLEHPEMTCYLNGELKKNVITVPERPADNNIGKTGPYSISFKRDARNRVTGLIVKDEKLPNIETHYRKRIGHRDFR